jgi:branched-chain amino acid transport system ATP-binding protein
VALLEVQHLSKHFAGLAALNDCHLTLQAGQIHALIGPNGAGKTTLINQISGSLFPSKGHIRFAGQEVTHTPQHLRVQLGLARTYQITNLFRSYTVLDNIALGVQGRHGSSFRFWKPLRSERHLFEEAAQIGQRVGLESRLYTPVSQLSHGEQRQLEVALALACKPKLLLLDEPMAGMGPEESGRMVELIGALGREFSILLVEHDMDAVFMLSNQISVLVYGQVIASGLPEEIRANPQVHKAYLGDEA